MLIPDHETQVDFLNYEAIARTVIQLLADNRQRALTIGIHGDWGAGKSSILKMIEGALTRDKSVAVLWFNGWTFQGFDDAKTVLIESTITELCRQRSAYGKVKEIGARLIRRVDWLKLAKRGSGIAFNLVTGMPSPDQIGTIVSGLGAMAGRVKDIPAEDVEAAVGEALSLLKPDEGGTSVSEEIHHFREEFRRLLDEAKIEQLVVLIDDLDRCLPPTAIETLEAIRLFLFVPKTAFVIGADEAMIEYAVRQHFPDLPLASGPVPYVRNYLEKLIQVPFRVPALGVVETRIYMTLLLVEALVGEGTAGFAPLLDKARTAMNQPWLGLGLTQADIRAVDPSRRSELDAAFFLAQRIGSVLAEGTRGNPRQIKRFLNALMLRQAIAKARGFDALVNSPVLAKLMLAERFQPDLFEHLCVQAMAAGDGRAPSLAALEAKPAETKKGAKATGAKKAAEAVKEPDRSFEGVTKWLNRDWVQRWVKIEPALSEVDLRPYIFVSRDKRVLADTKGPTGLDGLIEKLSGSDLAVRTAEQEVRALGAADAEQVFGALRESVLRQGDLSGPPPGLNGMGIVAKHHTRFQTELVALLGSLDAKALGMWVVRGWNEVITDAAAKDQLRALIIQWANQTDNAMLKRAAEMALPTINAGAG